MTEQEYIDALERWVKRCEKYETALESISAWELPSTEETWPDGTPVSYGTLYGSNGERQHIREIARKALEDE